MPGDGTGDSIDAVLRHRSFIQLHTQPGFVGHACVAVRYLDRLDDQVVFAHEVPDNIRR